MVVLRGPKTPRILTPGPGSCATSAHSGSRRRPGPGRHREAVRPASATGAPLTLGCARSFEVAMFSCFGLLNPNSCYDEYSCSPALPTNHCHITTKRCQRSWRAANRRSPCPQDAKSSQGLGQQPRVGAEPTAPASWEHEEVACSSTFSHGDGSSFGSRSLLTLHVLSETCAN